MPGNMYFIQGVYFQHQSGLASLDPGELVIATHACARPFWGRIIRILGTAECIGSIFDAIGEADLSNISLNEDELRFRKRYAKELNHPHPIDYRYSRQPDGTWTGEYRVDSIGPISLQGVTRCVLAPMPPYFFAFPPEMLDVSPNALDLCFEEAYRLYQRGADSPVSRQDFRGFWENLSDRERTYWFDQFQKNAEQLLAYSE